MEVKCCAVHEDPHRRGGGNNVHLKGEGTNGSIFDFPTTSCEGANEREVAVECRYYSRPFLEIGMVADYYKVD